MNSDITLPELPGGPVYAAFRDKDGEPVSYLRVEFEKDEGSRFVGLILSMIRALDAHEGNYRTGPTDRNLPLALEALAETVKVNMGVDETDAVPQMMLDIEAFHQKFGLEYLGKPRALTGELHDFRLKFMREEIDEYEDEQVGLVVALADNDERRITHGLEAQLDALVDEVYVALGTAYLQFGVDVFHEAWRRVQTANMAKVRVNAETLEGSKRGSAFDVVKPEGWVAPSHIDLVRDHEHILFRMPGQLNPGHEHDTSAIPPKQG